MTTATIPSRLVRELERFLDQKGDVATARRFLDDDEVHALSADVFAVMARPLDEHIQSKRIAFGQAHRLEYPTEEAQVFDLANADTSILQSLELSGGILAAVAEMCQAVLNRPTGISCYVSSPTSNAFDWHTDAWDSLIIQLAGKKSFHFRDRGEKFMQRLDSPSEDRFQAVSGPARAVTLSSGDVLIFRARCEHRTSTIEASMHLSVAVRNPRAPS